MTKLRTLLALSLLFACGGKGGQPASTPPVAQPAPVPAPAGGEALAVAQESAVFLLHKVEHRIGEERVIVQKGLRPEIRSLFVLSDRGNRASLAATLSLGENGLPRRLEMWGQLSPAATDLDVTIEGDQARIRDGAASRAIAVPALYFTATGHAPMGVKEALIAAWHRHGRHGSIPLVPEATASLQKRGDDVFELGGKPITLERLTLAGMTWGRELLWIDAQQRLIAVVTNEAGGNQIQVVREGYEALLNQFVVRAGSEGAAILAAQATAPIREGRHAIVHARLIDGTGAAPIDEAVIVIDDGKIVSAGKGEVPADVPTLDARGQTVLPGLWDMHAHFEQAEWGPIYLAAGVTTVRDVGNSLSFLTGLRDAELVPRILCAGIIDGADGNAISSLIVRSERDVKPLVAKVKAAGCSQIKIYGVVAPDLVAPLAKEAHRQGLTVAGHVPQGMTLREAVTAGIDVVSHLDGPISAIYPEWMDTGPAGPGFLALDVESAQARSVYAWLVKRKTVLDPTLALMELLLLGTAHEPGAVKVAPELAKVLTSIGPGPGATAEEMAMRTSIDEKIMAVIGALHRAGVTIVAGTDSCIPGHSLHREIELYVEAGMSPMEAIQSATAVPARVMGLEREVGTIAPGKRADLILVNGDPLANISDLRKITTVVIGGRAFETARLWPLAGFKP